MAPGPNESHAPSSRLSSEIATRLLAFVERTSDLVGMTDDAGRVVYLNEAAHQRLGITPGSAWPETTADLFTDDAFETYFEEVRPAILRGDAWSGELKARTAAGDVFDVWVTVAGSAGPGGEVTWLVMSARDITARLAAEAELSRRATHDELTDLPGRTVLFERIELALHRARRTGGLAAVLFIDVNDLKAVNDRLGHHAGDEMLIEVSRRLQRAVRTIDTVARVGGDEFVVLLDGIAPHRRAAMLATRIQAAVETAPLRVGAAEVNVSVSIGVTVSSGEDETDVGAILRRADAAMYEVKRARHRSPSSGAATGAAREVAVAVTQLAVRPWYQPVFRLGTGGVEGFAGFQVLARWLLPDGVVLPAADFVPGIDGTGVAFSLDLAVLREATRAVAALDRSPPPRVWAHLSSRSLRTPEADHFIHQILEYLRFEPSLLSLEIAEDLVVASDAPVAEAVVRLRELGAHLVVTVADPGRLELIERTELSPLVDELRLGGAFMATLRETPAVLAAVVERSRARGWQVHLSGIESGEDLELAAALGVDLAIGLHLGSPDREPNIPAIAV
jgi:diguanylate cyclase (GGDEF)-like protein/PAS domain S-box-containing protein